MRKAVIQHQLLYNPDQVRHGVELKHKLKPCGVDTGGVKNWGHEHAQKQTAPQPVNGVSKVNIHGRKYLSLIHI